MKQLQIFYSYYFAREKQLTALLMQNDTESAKAIVDSVFEEVLKHKEKQAELIKIIFYDIVGTVLKVVHEMITDTSEIFDMVEQADSFINHGDYDSLRKLCYDLMTVAYVSIVKKDKVPAIGKIIDYIVDNYDDPMLTVTTIADKFGIHPNYLSNIFKNHKGVTVMNYLTDVRIHKSKHFLTETQLTVEQIAQQVGYTNAHTFTRAFKKLEEIPPSSFRKRFNDWGKRQIKESRTFK